MNEKDSPVSPGTFPTAEEESKIFPCVCCDGDSSDDAMKKTKKKLPGNYNW